MSGCDCDYHQVQNAWKAAHPRASKQQQEAIYFAYWSTHCARCGGVVPFAGHADFALCEPCDAAMAAGA